MTMNDAIYFGKKVFFTGAAVFMMYGGVTGKETENIQTSVVVQQDNLAVKIFKIKEAAKTKPVTIGDLFGKNVTYHELTLGNYVVVANDDFLAIFEMKNVKGRSAVFDLNGDGILDVYAENFGYPNDFRRTDILNNANNFYNSKETEKSSSLGQYKNLNGFDENVRNLINKVYSNIL